MRLLLLTACLLISASLHAQTPGPQEKLELKAIYELAIRQFTQQNPQFIYPIGRPPGKVLFVKKAPYLAVVGDTISGVLVVEVDPDTDGPLVAQYIARRQKIVIADIQQLLMQATESFIWITPMKAAFNPRKASLKKPSYTNQLCEYKFGNSTETSGIFFYKSSACKQVAD